MSSLAHCLKRIGKKLSGAEKDAVKDAAGTYREEGYKGPVANVSAVEDILRDLEAEKTGIIAQIRKKAPKPVEKPVEAPPVEAEVPPVEAPEVTPEFQPKEKPFERAQKVGLSLEQLKTIFKGQEVGLLADGNVWVRTKKGHGLVIRAVNRIDDNRVAFEMGYGRMPKDGELMVGKYVDSTIELRKDMADKWTLYHELEHWAEDVGLLTDADIRALNAEIRAQTDKGIADPVSKEDRATFVEKALEEREKYRDRGRLNRILQKIQDFIDALVNIATRTARGVVREFEAGTVFSRVGVRPIITGGPEFVGTHPYWYSQMEKHLEDKLPGSGTPSQIKQTVQSWAKKGLIKQEELDWSGLVGWLDELEGKVKKRDVLDYLAENNVRLDEVLKSGRALDVEDYLGTFVIESEMRWLDAEHVEPLEEDLRDEVDYQKQTLLETNPEDYKDEEGGVDEEKLEEEAGNIAYEGYNEFGLSSRSREYESGWSIRFSSVDEIYEIYDADGKFVEQVDHTGANLRVAQVRVFELLEERNLGISDDRAQEIEESQELKFETHTIPGGEEYKELLLTLPVIRKTVPELHIEERENSYVALDSKGLQWGEVGKGVVENKEGAEKYLNRYIREREGEGEPEGYRPSVAHYEEPNVLVHIRFDERVGPKGEKILHIAEIQSDWLQEGKREGFAGPPLTKDDLEIKKVPVSEHERLIGTDTGSHIKDFRKANKIPLDAPLWAYRLKGEKGEYSWNLNFDSRMTEDQIADYALNAPQARAAHDSVIQREIRRRREGVPDAPFKKTWPLLAIKRMVRYASENMFDVVSWDTGSTQADRYDLSKQVDAIYVRKEKDGYRVEIVVGVDRHKDELQGRPLRGLSENQLTEMIGKDLAEKAIKKHGTKLDNDWYQYSGEDLKVGGEGMVNFYDLLLPFMANKFFNKAAWGKAKVKALDMPTGIERPYHLVDLGTFTRHLGSFEGIHETDAINYNESLSQSIIDKFHEAIRSLGEGVVKVNALPVTQEMRSKSYREGMPMFKAIAPEPATGKQLTVDLERDRSFANRIFEQRDVGVKAAEHETQQLQKDVQKLAGEKSIKKLTLGFAYDRELKRSRESDMLDMAMMVYRDLQINPAKAQEFREWAEKMLADPATPKSQKIQIKENLEIVDRVDKLTGEQKTFTEDVGRRFTRAFSIAKANKVVNAFHDYYVRRVWNLPKGRESDFTSTGAAYGFKTFTTAKLKRSFETILDGWMAGYELNIKGLTNSYGAYMSDLEAILANKDFIVQGYQTRDADNRRMFSTSSRGAYKNYAPLKAPGFKVWEWAGKAETEIAPDETGALIIDEYGRRFFFSPIDRIPEMFSVHKVRDDGVVTRRALRVFLDEQSAQRFADERGYETVIRHRPPKDVADAWERRELYAPKQLAEIINKMTQGETLFPTTPALESIGRLNAGMKAWLLLSSFFHHIAGARSWGFGVHHGWKAGKVLVDPMTGEAYTASGWNFVRAYKEGLKKIEDRAPIITLGIKQGLTLGELQDWSEVMLRDRRGLSDRLARHLGMERVSKGFAYGRFLREKFTDSLFKKYFTGLKAEAFVMEYMHELQKAQTAHLTKGAPAPNVNLIAEQVARLINADFGGLHLQRMGRNPTLQKMMRLLLLAPDWTESNFRTVTGMIPGLNEFITKAIGDVKPPPGMDKIYRKFWGRVVLRIALLTVITQLLLNGTDESEEFWREQALTSRFRKNRWLEVDITSIYKALGIDPEGKRKTFSIGGHFFDPLKLFDPARLIKHKGSPIVRVIEAVAGGADWRERPFVPLKELITERKTVKESPYAEKEQFFDRLPAAAVNVITNLQPVQVGYAIRYLQGEDDGLSSLMRGAGMQIHTAYPARMEGPMAPGRGYDEAYEELQKLAKEEVLTMGPPSRRITVGGISQKMTPAQYSEYLTGSSDLIRMRLTKLIGTERWEKMTPVRRANVVEKIVRSSRKRARAKLKRRDFKVRYPQKWSKKEESLFVKWYKDMASKWGLNSDPDDPKHHYDYRRAYRAGASPDKTGHWPSKFKAKTHPRRFVGGIDTITEWRQTE